MGRHDARWARRALFGGALVIGLSTGGPACRSNEPSADAAAQAPEAAQGGSQRGSADSPAPAIAPTAAPEGAAGRVARGDNQAPPPGDGHGAARTPSASPRPGGELHIDVAKQVAGASPGRAYFHSHALLLKLGLPPGVGSRAVAAIEIKYKDRIRKKNAAEESPLKLTYAEGDADSAASADASVARTLQGFAAGETLAEAARHIALGDRSRAGALLAEREGILRTAAETLKEPLFLRDTDRLARLREHTGSMAGVGDPLVLAMLLETASQTHLH